MPWRHLWTSRNSTCLQNADNHNRDSVFPVQDEGLDHRDVDLSSQDQWDRVRDAVASAPTSFGRLVHLRHPSKQVYTCLQLIEFGDFLLLVFECVKSDMQQILFLDK